MGKNDQKRQYVMSGPGGAEIVLEQGSNGKFRLLNPPTEAPAPTQTDLATLVSDARTRMDDLPSHQARVQGYARQDTLPVDLEDMMVIRSGRLDRVPPCKSKRGCYRTRSFNNCATRPPNSRPLGGQMRTAQSLVNTKNLPTACCDDLIGQNAVEIRKTRAAQKLGKRKNGQATICRNTKSGIGRRLPPSCCGMPTSITTSAKPAFAQIRKSPLETAATPFSDPC